jgi:hypothetical protein
MDNDTVCQCGTRVKTRVTVELAQGIKNAMDSGDGVSVRNRAEWAKRRQAAQERSAQMGLRDTGMGVSLNIRITPVGNTFTVIIDPPDGVARERYELPQGEADELFETLQEAIETHLGVQL